MVSRVPRMGLPKAWPRQKFSENVSWTRSSGLSRAILISSRMTDFSRVISSGGNAGAKTMSEMMSKAAGRCSSRTRTLKQTSSLEVNASSMPPMRSASRAMSSAVRRAVPLKTMCSRKWEMPLSLLGSRRDPCSSQMPTLTLRTCCIGSVMTTSPFGSVDLWMIG
jgi:hypothetical protein